MRDQFGRYFTETLVSNLLINQLSSNCPSLVLDMGCGDGSLTQAAAQKWKNALYFAVDINQTCKSSLSNTSANIKFFKADVLAGNIRSVLGQQYGSFDVAICNPPYVKVEKSDANISILRRAGLINSINLRYFTSDLLFLAYNLLFLREGGEIGIILPDGLLTSHEFKLFREDIIKGFTIKSIIQLPDKVFSKTEARTHVLVLIKTKPSINRTNLFLAGIEGEKLDSISILQTDLAKRMDFWYHKWSQTKVRTLTTLKDFSALIRRGSMTKISLSSLNINYFHTTHFPKDNSNILRVADNQYNFDKGVIAEEGDILIARVGKRCIGKVCLVEKGRILITDCVYRVKVQPQYVETAFRALTSQHGMAWFSVFSHGVCSQVISKVDLLEFPIEVV